MKSIHDSAMLSRFIMVMVWMHSGMMACSSATTTVEGFPDSFVGIGIELTIRNNEPKVVRIIQGGPADAAGLQPTDVITAIDGQATVGLNLGKVVMALRGDKGTKVILTVQRKKIELSVIVIRTQMNLEKRQGQGQGYRASQ